MVENPFYDRPKKVLGMGECVGDEDRMFRRTLGPEILEVGSAGVAVLRKRKAFEHGGGGEGRGFEA